MVGLSRIILFLLSIAVVCAAVFSNEGHGQGRPGEILLNKEEQAEAAAVLNALEKGWVLVDNSPEVDFLVFVDEDREELDFYPKKFLIGRGADTTADDAAGLFGRITEPPSFLGDRYTSLCVKSTTTGERL